MEKANNILLKLLGLLLLAAAVMKGYQLLTEPVANKDIWTNRAFMIFTVEFEIALGIWLLSGIYKKLSWLAALLCFSMFSIITFYKGITGADSCGCFGSAQINPWVTLFAVDLPVIVALLIFGYKNLSWLKETLKKPSRIIHNIGDNLKISLGKIACAAIIILSVGITAPLLALNEPPKQTSEYVILEPSNWIGKPLPIINHIDIGYKLKTGTWLVLFYHYDCPNCQEAIAELEKIIFENADFSVAVIEVPPYDSPIETNCLYGRLLDVKEWFITTPVIALLKNGDVKHTWEQELPALDGVLDNLYTKIKGHIFVRRGGD